VLEQARPPRSPVASALHEWRARAARAARIEPAALLNDHLLDAIAAVALADVEALRAVKGVGDRFVDHFGADVLAAVSAASNDSHAVG
jgi:ATP-dependent DNA helicase RecQ